MVVGRVVVGRVVVGRLVVDRVVVCWVMLSHPRVHSIMIATNHGENRPPPTYVGYSKASRPYGSSANTDGSCIAVDLCASFSRSSLCG